MKKVLFTLVLLVPGMLFAQAWSGILSPTSGGGACTLAPAGAAASCAIDWTQVGVGGIPARLTTCSTISAATYSNGASDATSGIQTALNGCASGQTVLLSAGTFKINTTLSIPSNVTLRGAGADQTILSVNGSSNAPIQMGSSSPSFPGTAISSGATAGSTSIVVASATGITVGKYLVISELNDANFVTSEGSEGNCDWCGSGAGTLGNRSRGQIVEVTSVSGTTIGISPALYTDYSSTPLAATLTATKNAGVENLQVFANNTGYTADFYMSGCAYCWLKGVEANYTDGDFVQVHWGYRDEIRDSYFSNAYGHSSGNTDSDVFIVDKTSASLVENNIVERGHVAILLNWGSAGNVISYNYTQGEFDSGSTNFLIGGIGFHGAHPQFNLIEGNVIEQFYPDSVWGTSSHNTLFRNWATGTTNACNPTSGRATVTSTCHATFQASRAMQVAWLSYYYNFVGNVAGSAAQNALLSGGSPTSHVAILQYPSTRSYDSTNYNFSFGYGESSDDGTGGDGCSVGANVTPCHSTKAFSTVFMHGNYTYANSTISWSGALTHTLPASFYLSAQPSWWSNSIPYPAIGPDVTGGPGGNGHAYMIPAQRCYITTMGGVNGATGSPLTFNANTCYAAVATTYPRVLGGAHIHGGGHVIH
jgi:hypothetical protein